VIPSFLCESAAGLSMMGRLNQDQGRFFYSFCLDEVVPDDHRVRVLLGLSLADKH